MSLFNFGKKEVAQAAPFDGLGMAALQATAQSGAAKAVLDPNIRERAYSALAAMRDKMSETLTEAYFTKHPQAPVGMRFGRSPEGNTFWGKIWDEPLAHAVVDVINADHQKNGYATAINFGRASGDYWAVYVANSPQALEAIPRGEPDRSYFLSDWPSAP